MAITSPPHGRTAHVLNRPRRHHNITWGSSSMESRAPLLTRAADALCLLLKYPPYSIPSSSPRAIGLNASQPRPPARQVGIIGTDGHRRTDTRTDERTGVFRPWQRVVCAQRNRRSATVPSALVDGTAFRRGAWEVASNWCQFPASFHFESNGMFWPPVSPSDRPTDGPSVRPWCRLGVFVPRRPTVTMRNPGLESKDSKRKAARRPLWQAINHEPGTLI